MRVSHSSLGGHGLRTRRASGREPQDATEGAQTGRKVGRFMNPVKGETHSTPEGTGP